MFAGYKARTKRGFSTVSREFDINSESPLWGKFSCYNILHLESQQNGTLLSVISYYDESDDDMSTVNFDVPNDEFNDNEEYVLSMPCENAILDDHDDILSFKRVL
jgi:hypothetical protein